MHRGFYYYYSEFSVTGITTSLYVQNETYHCKRLILTLTKAQCMNREKFQANEISCHNTSLPTISNETSKNVYIKESNTQPRHGSKKFFQFFKFQPEKVAEASDVHGRNTEEATGMLTSVTYTACTNGNGYVSVSTSCYHIVGGDRCA